MAENPSRPYHGVMSDTMMEGPAPDDEESLAALMNRSHRALLLVDIQPTFCEGGALAVAGGNDVARKVAEFARTNRDNYAVIVSTQDWHIDPGSHFSDNPDFVDTWPPHGVAGTAEAELHPRIEELPDERVKKGHYSAAYSGFEGVTDDGRSLADVLAEYEITACDVVGLAQSHCVKDTALDAKSKFDDVRVFTDLTQPVSPELGERAALILRGAGIEQLESKDAWL